MSAAARKLPLVASSSSSPQQHHDDDALLFDPSLGRALSKLARRAIGGATSGGRLFASKFRALCVATGIALDKMPLALGTKDPSACVREWRAAMVARRLAALAAAPKWAEIREEASQFVYSMFPLGAATPKALEEQFVEVCALLVNIRVPQAAAQSAAKVAARDLLAEAASGDSPSAHAKLPRQSSERVAELLCEYALSDVFLPPRWWETDQEGGQAPAQLVRLCTKTEPSSVLLEYSPRDGLHAPGRPRHVRQRVFHLEHELKPEGSVLGLARKLGPYVSGLVGLREDQMVSVLQRLQRRLREIEEAAQEEEDYDEEDFEDTAADGRVGHRRATPSTQTQQSALSLAEKNKADLGLLYRDPDAALRDVDLQDADDLTVKEFKKAMDAKFHGTRLKPGDQGYVYDKRVQVVPTAKSEWDDD